MGTQNEINITLSKGTLSLTTVSRIIVSIMTHIRGGFHKTVYNRLTIVL